MIKILSGLPDNVLGVSADGRITATEFETILIPAIEANLKANIKARLLFQLGPDFKGMEIQAFFDDLKLGFKHLTAWEKVAYVTDHDLLNKVAKLFDHLMHTQIKAFKVNELKEAKIWIAKD